MQYWRQQALIGAVSGIMFSIYPRKGGNRMSSKRDELFWLLKDLESGKLTLGFIYGQIKKIYEFDRALLEEAIQYIKDYHWMECGKADDIVARAKERLG
jgi:hypothetical protein